MIAPQKAPCTSCGYALHVPGAINAETNRMCEVGDVSVCPRCGCQVLYTDEGIQEITASELQELQTSQPDVYKKLAREAMVQPARYRRAKARMN
jgi:hypothetical protein